MFKKIISYKKYKNLYDTKSLEFPASSMVSVIFLIFLILKLNLYENFFEFQEFLSSFLSNAIFGFIGFIGFILSAVSIILGMFNKNIKLEFRYLEVNNLDETKKNLEFYIYDFIFMAFVIAFEIILMLIILLLLNSNENLTNSSTLFYILTFIVLYLFFYIIFGSIGLIEECYLIFNLKNKLEVINDADEELKEIYNSYLTLEESYYNHLKLNKTKHKSKDEYIIGYIIYIDRCVPNQDIKKKYLKILQLKENLEETYIEKILRN